MYSGFGQNAFNQHYFWLTVQLHLIFHILLVHRKRLGFQNNQILNVVIGQQILCQSASPSDLFSQKQFKAILATFIFHFVAHLIVQFLTRAYLPVIQQIQFFVAPSFQLLLVVTATCKFSNNGSNQFFINQILFSRVIDSIDLCLITNSVSLNYLMHFFVGFIDAPTLIMCEFPHFFIAPTLFKPVILRFSFIRQNHVGDYYSSNHSSD